MSRKADFLEGYSWFKFNNFELKPGMALKIYNSLAKGSKVKVSKFWRLISTFGGVTEKKLVGVLFCYPLLNRVIFWLYQIVFDAPKFWAL